MEVACTVAFCYCPNGRGSNLIGTIWEIVTCCCKGCSQGSHVSCSQLSSRQWHCKQCSYVLQLIQKAIRSDMKLCPVLDVPCEPSTLTSQNTFILLDPAFQLESPSSFPMALQHYDIEIANPVEDAGRADVYQSINIDQSGLTAQKLQQAGKLSSTNANIHHYTDPSIISTKTKELRYKCKRCEKTFASLKNLRKHEVTHDGIYRCVVGKCKEGFLSFMDYTEHLKFHSAKRYLCSYEGCYSGSFKTPENLMDHEEIFHSDTNGYKCTFPDCTETFRSSQRLSWHLKIASHHTGGKP